MRSASYPLTAVVAWGLMFAVLGRALRHVDAVNLAAIRYGAATLLFVAVLVAREGWSALRPRGRLVEISVLGVLGFAVFNLLLGLALERTRPQNAALIVAVSPLLTVLVRWVRDRMRPSVTTLLLVVVALSGVALVVTKGHPDLGALGGGDALMLAGVAGFATYTHGASRFTGWSPLRYTTQSALAGTVALVGAAAISDALGAAHLPAARDLRATWPELAYVVLAGSVIAVLAWNTGIQRLGAPNAALFMNLVPLVALAEAAVQGYRPGAVELAGMTVTVAAVVATNLVGRAGRPARVLEPSRPAPLLAAAPHSAAGRRAPAPRPAPLPAAAHPGLSGISPRDLGNSVGRG